MILASHLKIEPESTPKPQGFAQNPFNIMIIIITKYKNYNIANKFRQNPGWLASSFECKMAHRPFKFNSVALFRSSNYGVIVKLQ